ncbi:bile acid:sodium symporter family protein [Desulfovibrio intestinalis]|uniref:BASS family bile acid:Na+ symporter n=1 Tax=Desulfovibrio intestinalis TaxID=58621 RepID=A0A7W8C3X1_9BACT|nr:bile acid:sodium symporter family protein [Desulfovibrio intestinalis]MBB5143819.1 BASS family bile acid:Na+ symporter [Desulfovibrio intestinalis]
MLRLAIKISAAITRYMGIVVIACSVLALWKPELFLWVAPYITILLGLIMFGMGMTLRVGDFSHVLANPARILLGIAAQFVIMSLLAFVLCHICALPPDIAMGLILVGAAPGGTAANVLAYIAKGNVPYAVTLTSVGTFLSLFLMPLFTWLLGGVWIPVDVWGLMFSISKIVVVPVLLGLVAHRFFSGFTKNALPFLPLLSALTITLVVAGILAINAGNILKAGLDILVAVVCLNISGLGLGSLLARFMRFDTSTARAFCLSVGTKNSGLATALALAHFSPSAAIAGALYSVWQNISGALLSNFFHTRQQKSPPTKDR